MSDDEYEGNKTRLRAVNAALVMQEPGAETAGYVFHGPMNNQQGFETSKPSTVKGDLVPPKWDAQDRLNEGFLAKGGTVLKVRTACCQPKTTFVDASQEKHKPTELFENITASEIEVRRIHEAHVQKQSKIDFPQLLQRFAQNETVIAEIPCKAIVNAPSSGYDILGDSIMFLTEGGSGKSQYPRRRIYFVQNVEHRDFNAMHGIETEACACCGLEICLRACCKMTAEQDEIQYSLQNVSHMDLITVEDQLLQVDGTKLQKSMKKLEYSCCDCCNICRCKCRFCTPKESVRKYEVQARTAKALKSLVLSESKIKSTRPLNSEEGGVGFDYETTVTKSNYTAVYLRYRNPLDHSLKETVVLVSPSEPLAEVFNFVGIVSQPPNLMQVGSPEYTAASGGKPSMMNSMDHLKLDFNPKSSICNDVRTLASFTGGVPVAHKPEESSSLMGLANFGMTAASTSFDNADEGKGSRRMCTIS